MCMIICFYGQYAQLAVTSSFASNTSFCALPMSIQKQPFQICGMGGGDCLVWMKNYEGCTGSKMGESC